MDRRNKAIRSSFTLLIFAAVLMALAPACNRKNSESPPATPPSQSSGAGAANSPARPKLTDPQIAAIVVAANEVDIDAGKLALEKSKNEEVRKFAQRMVTDHSAVNKAAVELVTRLKVTPEESDASRGLTSGGIATRATLGKLDGDAFDRAYVDNEVAYHKAVIGVLESQLIPSAANPGLESTLVGVMPAFAEHLMHAEHLQAALAGAGSGSSASAAQGM